MSTPIHRPRHALFQPALIALAGSAILFAAIGQFTDVDLHLADLHFDPVRGLFPWDRTWFGRDFMHGSVKNVIVWLGSLLIAAALVDLVRPLRRLTPLGRARLRVLALAACLEPTLIGALKRHSALHCPWAIDRYGGNHPFLRLLDAVPAGWHPGHCFPAGHASTAMWLSAFAVLWLPHAPRKALAAFAAGISAGLALGWVQQMRGQHFLTHTLWTAWLASALLLALLALFSRRLLAPSDTRSGA
ncbi:MAG: phosphatase PAP2 family protein [Rhodocyclaceae bacterium]|nr:phosphatase PAP2 family protein [Rhodocyclaceae bacterium]